jgi:Fuc2NAc and GlcNAc transferase
MLELMAFFLSMGLTWWIRRYALMKDIMDIPNERSLHALPTPRGGGLAIVIAFYCGLLWLFIQREIDPILFWATLCAMPVAAISLVDDAITLSPKIRLIVQSMAALGAIIVLRNHLVLDFYWFRLEGVWSVPIYFLGILWLTNLYNFLDGIDGYAA